MKATTAENEQKDRQLSDREWLEQELARIRFKLGALYLEEGPPLKREHVLHAFTEALGAFMLEAIASDPAMQPRCEHLVSMLALCITPGRGC